MLNPMDTYLPGFGVATDPAGIEPQRESVELLVHAQDSSGAAIPVQKSPSWSWYTGTPYPGPPATVWKHADFNSRDWWGRTGQGQLVWSEQTEAMPPAPPAVPTDLLQHIDVWQRFQGGYPSIARNRPPTFGDQVPVFNPIYPE